MDKHVFRIVASYFLHAVNWFKQLSPHRELALVSSMQPFRRPKMMEAGGRCHARIRYRTARQVGVAPKYLIMMRRGDTLVQQPVFRCGMRPRELRRTGLLIFAVVALAGCETSTRVSLKAATVGNIRSVDGAKNVLGNATGKFCPSIWCGVEGYQIGSIALSDDGRALLMTRDDGTRGDSISVASLNPQGGTILGQGVVHFSGAFAPNLVTTEMEAQRLITALDVLKSASASPSPMVTPEVRRSVADASAVGSEGASQTAVGSLYDVEPKIPFNVLDSVYFDAASGELTLVGHHDDRFKGAGIPYLQHLATLLENPKPEFSLAWTPESSAQVDALFARELTQQESDEQATRLGTIVDSSGAVTHTGALMLPALGIYPIDDDRAPGDLGVEVRSINGGRVVIMKVKAGSAAEKAGSKPPAAVAAAGSAATSPAVGGRELVNLCQETSQLAALDKNSSDQNRMKVELTGRLNDLEQQRSQLVWAVQRAGPAGGP